LKRLIALSLLWATAAQANPPDIYGFGARAVGMAGAMTAAVDDTTANFYNPAALTRNSVLQIDTGYLLTHTRLRLNDQDLGVDESSGMQAGVTIPGKIRGVNLAFGMGFFIPQTRLSRVRALPQHQPRFVLYDNRPQRLFVTCNLAIQPLPWLHIGAGVNFLVHTIGTVNLEGLIFLNEVSRSTLPTSVAVDFVTVRYPSFGILITPNGQWSLGLSFRDQVSVVLDLGAHVEGALVLGQSLIPGAFQLSSLNNNLFSPRQLWLGATFRPFANLLLSLDGGWLQWSNFPSPTARVDIELDIANFPTDGLIPPTVDVVEPEFDDIFSARFGLEWTLALGPTVDLLLRTGYAFEPTPAPDQPAGTNYVDSHKHIVSAGVGLEWRNWSPHVAAPVSIDVGAQWIRLNQREYLKTSAADIVGDYRADGSLISIAGTIRWRF
jgi:long-chain fatty acid transport protein